MEGRAFIIENVPYFSQRDNEVDPGVSCFPTSMGMVMAFCLAKAKKSKAAIGCQSNEQIEDFLNKFMSSTTVTDWIRANAPRIGSWVKSATRREVHVVEEFAFNHVMGKVGFKDTLRLDMTFDEYAAKIEDTGLPMVIGGNFKSVSGVGGHMTCAVGFDTREGKRELIVHDPWGYALTGYKDRKNGAYRSYPSSLYFKNAKGDMYAHVVERAR